MRKIKHFLLLLSVSFFTLVLVVCTACGGNSNAFPERVELSSALVSEIEFDNDESVSLEQNKNQIKISGTINAMSKSQKHAFGNDEVTHVVVLKLTFDKERTLSYFKISGKTTKVYSDDNTVPGYSGKITDLLDSEDGEDAYCNLVLSANTSSYDALIKYTDGQEVNLSIEIVATLATASAQ